tara:strand:+ start:3576 stop:4370 length:795 start_codon:yes stop_codon:yes gene_type:complete
MDLYFLLNILYNCAIVVGTITIGSGLAIIVSSLTYRSGIDDDGWYEEEEKEASLYDKICLYEQKYLDEFHELEDRQLSDEELNKLTDKFVDDETPSGKVIMLYNKGTESFWYYCDTKTLTYRTLDTIARLFAIKYNCKQICVDYKKEWDKGKESAMAQKEDDEKSIPEDSLSDEDDCEEEEQEKSVFAQFKSYNIIKNRSNNKSEKGVKNKRYYIYTEKANRFSYKGLYEEYVDPCKPTEIIDSKKKLSFLQFKKLKDYNKKNL